MVIIELENRFKELHPVSIGNCMIPLDVASAFGLVVDFALLAPDAALGEPAIIEGSLRK